MDNGLIFPYPRVFDKGEAHDTNHPRSHRLVPFGGLVVGVCVGPECVVAE